MPVVTSSAMSSSTRQHLHVMDVKNGGFGSLLETIVHQLSQFVASVNVSCFDLSIVLGSCYALPKIALLSFLETVVSPSMTY